jgi:hypothetical protein
VEPHAERRSLANSVTGDLTSARPEPKPALPPVDRTIKTVGEPIGPFIPLHWDDEKSGQVVLIWVRASLVRTVRLRKVSGRRADRGAKRPGCLVIMANGTTYPVLEEIGAVLQALAEVE